MTTLDRFKALPPRTRQLVYHAATRPELRLTDVAMLVGVSIGNMRDRMNKAYDLLQVKGRCELIAVFGPLLVESTSSE